MAQVHDHWTRQSDIFALGALDGREREEFEAHLAAGCAICAAHVRETGEVLAVLHRTIKPMAPPPAIKAKVFDRIAIDNVVPIGLMVLVSKPS